MMTILIEILGWSGMFLVLLAYLLITANRLDRDSRLFHSLNCIGGISIGVNSVLNGAYPSGALNLLWALIAVYGLLKSFKS